MVKTVVTLPFSKAKIFKAFTDQNCIKKWDKNNYDHETLETGTQDDYSWAFKYYKMHFPWPMSDRDWVTKRKMWDPFLGNPKFGLIQAKSIVDKRKPETGKLVRANMINMGFILDEVSPTQTKFLLLNKVDVQAGAVQGTVDSKSPGAAKEFVENLCKGCQMVQ